MNTWWNSLNLRERIILSLAGLIILFIVMDNFILDEFRLNYQRLDGQLEQAKDDLDWMKQAVLRLPDQNKGSVKIKSGKLVSFIDQQITRLGLKPTMQQMTPIEDHSVRVKFAEVEFDRLLNFFSAIEGSVSILEVRLLPSDTKGLVNVSLIVGNGSAS